MKAWVRKIIDPSRRQDDHELFHRKRSKPLKSGRSSDLLLSLEAFPVANQWHFFHDILKLTAAGTVQDLHPIPYYSIITGTNFAAKVEINCKD